MRVGKNPQRNKKINLDKYNHQVIIPVYIPNLEKYYRQSFEIFKLSLNSLLKTVNNQTYITVICNGSCVEVEEYVLNQYLSGNINDVIITSGIGKVNSILKGISGINLPLLTISDADVLFLNNWQQETYKVFDSFPRAGVVSPVPNPSQSFYYTENIYLNYMFSEKILKHPVVNKQALIRFAESIGALSLFEKYYCKDYLILKGKNECKAVVGAGHFVATYKTSIFKYLKRHTDYQLGGESEEEYLDKPPFLKGLFRLSTMDNYAYHLGNTVEDWMLKTHNETLRSKKQETVFPENLIEIKFSNYQKIQNWISRQLVGSTKFKQLILCKFKN
ncbi:glycosyltransferase family 2 protein [Formosa sediminum]|uniref:Glycosyltransferase family 2 protein n=1 Tax=Formosa sediminum TaxID=2594004 RepID=A0A516GRN5_9FLAO|nr:glycosyltransferase family 2 protein [Formosa sediminum]QDO94176.1 glycosyltransferase family 2 protein [Formosa sediminum]